MLGFFIPSIYDKDLKMISQNIKYPIYDDTIKNSFFTTTKTSKDSFSSKLLLLLLTNKGERYYNPEYGTNLLKYIFEPNDNITSIDIKDDISRTVSKYLPAISIRDVVFDSNQDDNGLNVRVSFVYNEENFSEEGEVSISF